jgi:DNA-binding NarL/FixJ family response regulator
MGLPAETMPTPAAITVVLARFEDLFAVGVRAVISGDSNLEVVADDVEPSRLGVVLRAHRPQVAVLDVDTIPALGDVLELSRSFPDTKLVLIATRPTTTDCAQLLAFGACACLGRDIQGRDLLSAVHLAARGLSLMLRGNQALSAGAPGPQLLTHREAEVLPMLQAARSNAQIAAELHVTVETVRTHAGNIYRKLGVSSRRDLPPPRPQAAWPPAQGSSVYPGRTRSAV